MKLMIASSNQEFWARAIPIFIVFAILFTTIPIPSVTAAGGVQVLQPWPDSPTATGTTSPVNTTFSVSPGSNRFMVVAVDFSTNSTIPSPGIIVSAVYGQGSDRYTYLAAITNHPSSDRTEKRSAWLFCLYEPDIASAGNNNLQVIVEGMPEGTGVVNGINVYVSTYTGVDQSGSHPPPFFTDTRNYYTSGTTTIGWSDLSVAAGGMVVFTLAVDSNTAGTLTEPGYTQTIYRKWPQMETIPIKVTRHILVQQPLLKLSLGIYPKQRGLLLLRSNL